ncbi:ABC transporter ATP-binding protein [Microvirga makkahensis]|uniref:Spermidine/putrescine import ATP-binding protein PotA n=1 Tax=Microvirga makkahensis TaxID=1128670 RepID=A0A7X3MS52_9HYPH|nr:ABC transporter ATP-binding protein [Microvirga makkahensis]MXQ12236.1 polyamine ABC transporter ATP-binding protein [Microvirga makkahensis]
MSFLELNRVGKRFGEHVAVEDMSLSVAKGEFISLLGPSGCGKTTTLQMIAGFMDPTAGSICLNGRDLTSVKPAKRGLGIVFQSYALFPHMTAAENIAFGLEMRGVPRAERDVRVREALAMVGLDGYADRYPRRMSGGQQQRVALARALVIKPDVLLLDEPLSNLDAKLREDMQIELRQIQRNIGTTTVLVTHDQTEAMALSDRIVVMSKGRIEQIGTPHETYERPASPFVSHFLGKTNEFQGEVIRRAGEALLVAGSCQWPAPVGPSGPVTITVRPEKVGFDSGSGNGVKARITNRIFQGNHWLFQCETECGPAIVVRQNTGEAQPAEGENVCLVWRAEDMGIRSVGGAS